MGGIHDIKSNLHDCSFIDFLISAPNVEHAFIAAWVSPDFRGFLTMDLPSANEAKIIARIV